MNRTRSQFGFTIIEVLVVITIIGILAAVVVVSYNGIQIKATDAGVLSDIDAMDGLQTNYGLRHKTSGKAYYSESGYDADLGFKPSKGNVVDVFINEDDYCIRGYNPNGTKNSATNSFQKESTQGACATILANQDWLIGQSEPGTSYGAYPGAKDALVGKYVYKEDLPGIYKWRETNVVCLPPQCSTSTNRVPPGFDTTHTSNSVLADPFDNGVNRGIDFTGYGGQLACGSIGGRVPMLDELAAIYAGQNDGRYGNNFDESTSGNYWSATEADGGHPFYVSFFNGNPGANIWKFSSLKIRCVK